jgi:putative NADH-flavin reductase
MHFLLLGATGRTGQHVVTDLLSQGHTAVALVRTPGSLTPRPGLTVVTGSPLSKPDIEAALSAAPALIPSAAIITLNTVRESDSPFAAQVSPPRFLADSCANACEVLEQAGIYRIVVMSTAGAGDSWPNLPLLSKAFMGWTNVKYALDDHNLLDTEIRLTKMNWTLVRPSRLDFEEPKQKPTDKKADLQTLDGKGKGMRMTDSASVSGVSKFLVKVAVEGLFIKSAVVVRNSGP